MNIRKRYIALLFAIFVIALLIGKDTFFSNAQSSTQVLVKTTEVGADNLDANIEDTNNTEVSKPDKAKLDYKQYDDVRDLDLGNKNYNLEDIKTYWFNENTYFGDHEDYADEIMKKDKNPGLGVAPKAEVYYAAVPSWIGDSKYFADALLCGPHALADRVSEIRMYKQNSYTNILLN